MPSSSARFDLLDFHDSPLIAIGRSDRTVRLELRYVHLPIDHPASTSARPVRVGPCTLVLHDVVSEQARLFDDATRDWVAHPAPDMPLDDAVIHARVEDVGAAQRFVFDGMHTSGWSEWHIVAQGFTLTWGAVLGDAWYARSDDGEAG